MRIPPLFLVLVIALAGRLFAQNSDPITVTGTIPAKSIVQTVGIPPIDLSGFFTIPTLTGKTVVQFTAVTGLTGAGAPITQKFNVVMDNTGVAQNTVANFLKYVNGGLFSNSIIHRSDQPGGIIQGGTYLNDPNLSSMVPLQSCSTISGSKTVTCQSTSRAAVGMTVTGTQIPAGATITSITNSTTFVISAAATSSATGKTFTIAYPPIALEATDNLQNGRGAIAMARMNDPNSATSGWFINTADNSSRLPPASASGYAAFGRVTGTGMTVVDAIQALPVLGGNVTVTSSSTANKLVTISSAPVNFGPGWGLLGSTIQSAIGNFITLNSNASQTIDNTNGPQTFASSLFAQPFDQLPVLQNLPPDGSVNLSNLATITSVQTVPLFPPASGAASVVTFSAVSSDPSLVSVSVSGSNLYVAAAKNLNGSATVTVTATDSNGNAVDQTPFNVSVTRTAVDFGTADGIEDLLFQNSVGQLAVWYNHSPSNGALLYGGGLGDWRVVAVADWNHDGVTDIIFQNTIGQIAIWYGGSPVNGAYLYTGGLGDWRVVGVADINRDGIPDLVFQNTVGQVAVWYSGLPANAAYIYSGGLGDWRVKCVADINGDGVPDLIFQNTVGQIAVWYSCSSANGASIYGGGLGDWKVVRIADINGDGVPDILLQNTVGQIAVWYNGSYLNGSYLYGGSLGDWRLR